MSFQFPRADVKTAGYESAQVDQFIEQAKFQYSNANLESVTANQVRQAQFDMVPGGYLVAAVDTAMDRLEDEFAAREIQRQKNLHGESAVADRKARITEIIQGRLNRPKRKKFSNTGWLLLGYSKKQVDELCGLVETHIKLGQPVALNTVRRAIFAAKRGGYVEAQVDAFIDRVVELLQIEKNS